MTLTLLLISVASMLIAGAAAAAEPGDLDTSFGASGIRLEPLGEGTYYPRDATCTDDGKLLVLAERVSPTPSVGVVVRYNPDGSIDRSFGTQGQVPLVGPGFTTFPAPKGSHLSVVQQGTAILVACNPIVWRLTAQGAIDTSFGLGGFVTLNGDGATAQDPLWTPVMAHWDIAFTEDGSIMSAGSVDVGRSFDLAIRRWTPHGDLDTSFAGSGTFIRDVANRTWDQLRGVVVRPDGRIIAVGGFGPTMGGTDIVLVGLTATGQLDSSFGQNGIGITIRSGSLFCPPIDLRVTSSGRLLIWDGGAGIAAFTSTGQLDTSFGASGVFLGYGPLGMDATFSSWTVQDDGKILLCGSRNKGYPSYQDVSLSRITADGQVDISFGEEGTATADYGAADDTGAVAQRPDGSIIVAAYQYSSGARTTRDGRSTSATPRAYGSSAIALMNFANDATVMVGRPLAYTRKKTVAVAWRRWVLAGQAQPYDVRYAAKPPGKKAGSPVTWLTAARATSASFAGRAGYTYTFSSRTKTLTGTPTAWSPLMTVIIDTAKPRTAGKAAKGKAKRAIKLRYRINDNLSPQATAVKLVVKNKRGKIVKRLNLKTKSTGKWYSVKWKPRSKGSYRYSVYAKDLAGNPQRKAAGGKITVR